MALGQENIVMDVVCLGSQCGGDAEWGEWPEVPKGKATRWQPRVGSCSLTNGPRRQLAVRGEAAVMLYSEEP